MSAETCIYCGKPANTTEHPLPAAFGEFENAPLLADSLCRACNGDKLGALDEQFTRSGPEGFLRRHYGIVGRSNHAPVNPFYRGSAGGGRLELISRDEATNVDVLLECANGEYQQLRQLIFVLEDGSTRHLPIRDDASPEHLRNAYDRLGVKGVKEVSLSCAADEVDRVRVLVSRVWPSVSFFEWKETAAVYDGGVVKITLTDRYFRAVAKIAFHYFLTQFRMFRGSEDVFSELRRFILTEGGPVIDANQLIRKRNHPLVGDALGGARPRGWRAHVLAAEIKNGECLAHVQTFLTEDWPAPIYTVSLGLAGSPDESFGHLYAYFENGPEGRYAGKTYDLQPTKVNATFPPASPVIVTD